jgi:hypothetical protein
MQAVAEEKKKAYRCIVWCSHPPAAAAPPPPMATAARESNKEKGKRGGGSGSGRGRGRRRPMIISDAQLHALEAASASAGLPPSPSSSSFGGVGTEKPFPHTSSSRNNEISHSTTPDSGVVEGKIGGIILAQKTPLRVLHRRAVATRERVVFRMKVPTSLDTKTNKQANKRTNTTNDFQLSFFLLTY